MSFCLTCPNCGQREYEEFRFGGELRTSPGDEPDATAWIDYLYSRRNAAGLQREWWYHQSGCRCWFVAERDLRTNEVVQTMRYTQASVPIYQAGGERSVV